MLKIENQDGVVLAFLNNLTEANVKEVLNGEYTLSFVAIIDHLKTDYLYDENNLINYNDDLFRVVSLEELHDEDDALTVDVTCEHISYDLIQNVMSDFNYTYKTASEVMLQCLFNTGFTLRYCEPTQKTDIQYTKECNSKQISIAIANNWDGELKYYRNYIDLLTRRGANRGTGFIFGKNLKSVKRIINRAEKTTSYEVDIIEGTETEDLGYYELGDTVRVSDSRLNIDYECRIIEIEKDILTGLNSKVILGDAIKDMRSEFGKSKDYADKIGADSRDYADKASNNAYNNACKASMPYWNKLNAVLDELGNLLPSKLKGDLNLATTNILNSTGTFEQRDNGLYWQDQPTKAASTFATFWSAQGIMFARGKDANGEWIWESALSADGLVATKVLASALEGLTVTAVTTTASVMKTGVIEGCNIKGGDLKIGSNYDSTFTGTNIREDGTIIGYNQGHETFGLRHSHSGRLHLSDFNTGDYVSIYSHDVTGPIIELPAGAQIRLGPYSEDYSGRQLGTRIELEHGNIQIITLNSSGTNTGAVTIAGDLNVKGDISCYSCNTQTGGN